MTARISPLPEPALRLPGVLWLLAGTFYLTCETISARAFAGYSYAHNYISDLGAPVAGVIGGRAVYSPLAGLMNVGGFMADGALFVVATLVAARATGALRSPLGAVLVVLGVVHGLGTVLVGAVPESAGAAAGAIPPLHVVGAAFSILGGNAALVLVGLAGERLGARRSYRAVSVVLGLFGLASLGLLEISRMGGLAHLPEGLLERCSVYPITAWELVTGVVLTLIPTTARFRPWRALRSRFRARWW